MNVIDKSTSFEIEDQDTDSIDSSDDSGCNGSIAAEEDESLHSSNPTIFEQNENGFIDIIDRSRNFGGYDDKQQSILKKNIVSNYFKDITTNFTDNILQSKISLVVANEFELERKLRLNVISFLKSEIARGQKLLQAIEKVIGYHSGQMDGAEMDHYYSNCTDNYNARFPPKSARGRKRKHFPRVARCVFGLRKDGSFVKLTCPVCARTDFGNRVGFINHCKHMHGINVINIEEYGTPVSDSEVPLDDPARRDHSVAALGELDDKLLEISAQEKENTALIKVFDEINSHDPLSKTPLSPQLSDNMKFYKDVVSSLPSTHYDNVLDSRFYIKKKILVGNVSMFIPTAKRGRNPLCTHKWMIYLRTPNHHNGKMDPLRSFVRSVKFFLHPSYKPRDVVTVSKAPFQLVRKGWGEFPIKIQIQFRDSDLNQPVELCHNLSLDRSQCGRQVQSPEQIFEIELDKDTYMVDPEEFSDSEDEKQIINAIDDEGDLSQPHTWNDSDGGDISEPVAEYVGYGTNVPIDFQPKYCKYCGSRNDIPRFDATLDTFRNGPDVLNHDPNRCQFRPIRKGKSKTSLTTLSDVDMLNQLIRVKRSNVDYENYTENSTKRDDLIFDVKFLISCCVKRFAFADDENPTAMYLANSMIRNPMQAILSLKYDRWNKTYAHLLAPPTEGDRNSAIAATSLTYLALRGFVKKLMESSVKVFKEEEVVEKEDEEMRKIMSFGTELKKMEVDVPEKILTPYHVFRAVFEQKEGVFDFLCNTYMYDAAQEH